MANKDDKTPHNVPGKFYIDSTCIACELCTSLAPKFFKMSEDSGFAYVYKQPSDPHEIEECQDALDQCPAESIGQDGP